MPRPLHISAAWVTAITAIFDHDANIPAHLKQPPHREATLELCLAVAWCTQELLRRLIPLALMETIQTAHGQRSALGDPWDVATAILAECDRGVYVPAGDDLLRALHLGEPLPERPLSSTDVPTRDDQPAPVAPPRSCAACGWAAHNDDAGVLRCEFAGPRQTLEAVDGWLDQQQLDDSLVPVNPTTTCPGWRTA